jgi:peptide/nickel transport system substrate-binding protein
MAPKDSQRLFIVDKKSFTPYRANVSVAADLAASIAGTALWATTLRFDDQVGGELNFAMPSILTQPWNPIAGSNWIYDNAPIRATGELATISDPYTGLALPNRIERVEVVAETGLPMVKTLDYVDLQFADSIEVPADAWYKWDSAEQRFITVGEAFTDTQTSMVKSTVYYPADLYTTVKWHDGSAFSLGDVIMGMIMTWEQADANSPIYDESQVSAVDAFMSIFHGVRIISTDPLVIETYTDGWSPDAEASFTTWWPYYAQGQSSWHMLTLGIMAEEAGELAFSASRAGELEVEYMSYIGGPSLEILRAKLESAAADTYIPFANTLGMYVTAEEAATRYANAISFNNFNGHFWVGTGVYVLDKVFPVAGTLTLVRFADHPDSADKWSGFGVAPVAQVELDGAGRVTTGQEASFDVFVNLGDSAYPSGDLNRVGYLVFDATGGLILQGDAELAEEGHYVVNLSADDTGKLAAGAGKIEVVVVSARVALPSFVSAEFVAVAP